MTTLDKLYAEKARVGEQRDALERRIEEIDAAICEAEGDTLGATWHRLNALGDTEAAHAAWLRMMAVSSIRMKRDPSAWITNDADARADEIRAEVARIQSEKDADLDDLLRDRPSHEVAPVEDI